MKMKVKHIMKRVLLLIAALVICGTSFAQSTHWPEFDLYEYEAHGSIVANIYINDAIVEGTDDYVNFEVGAFVNGEVRGHAFMDFFPNYGDLYPIVEIEVYYDNSGEKVSFMLYDHGTGVEYNYSTDTQNPDTGQALVTGEDYTEYDDPIMGIHVFNSFTMDINGYTTNGNGWYLIASPLASEADADGVLNMTDSTDPESVFDLFRFNQEADLEWENWKLEGDHHNFKLEPCRGYLYANSSDVTLTFIGAPYNSNGVVELKNAGQPWHCAGWNLIGNPYNTTANIGNRSFYRMNPQTNADIISATGNIAAMEGIFVYTENDSEEVQFNVNTRSENNGEMIVVNLTNREDVLLDRAMIRFDENVTLPKYMLDENHTNIYIPQGDGRYAVVEGSDAETMPVNFKADMVAEYVINVNSDDANVGYLHLIDKLTGEDVDMLVDGSYTFIGAPEDREDRFVLRFEPSSVNSCEEVFAYQSGNDIIVNGEGTLQVYDVLGRFVASYEVSDVTTIERPAESGLYIFKLIGEQQKTQKIVVR